MRLSNRMIGRLAAGHVQGQKCFGDVIQFVRLVESAIQMEMARELRKSRQRISVNSVDSVGSAVYYARAPATATLRSEPQSVLNAVPPLPVPLDHPSEFNPYNLQRLA